MFVFVLFRNKSVTSTETESANQQQKEPKEKPSSITSDEDRACVCDDGDDGSVKPVISSPVSHLWTSKDGITPLVRPEEATSTGVLHVLKDCLMPGLFKLASLNQMFLYEERYKNICLDLVSGNSRMNASIRSVLRSLSVW